MEKLNEVFPFIKENMRCAQCHDGQAQSRLNTLFINSPIGQKAVYATDHWSGMPPKRSHHPDPQLQEFEQELLKAALRREYFGYEGVLHRWLTEKECSIH